MEIFIENLKKYHGERQILDIESLNIKKGKITALTGNNGAGKTTLINIIAGLDREYQGAVKYDNKPLTREIAQNMTLVFQSPRLLKKKVFDNVAYPLKIRSMDQKEIKERVEAILRRFQVIHLKDNKGHRLSGGESQKISLARALVFEPRLLLLDEPMSNIDQEAVKIMEKEIELYNREKKATVLMITHNREQAERICNEIIEIDNGKLVK